MTAAEEMEAKRAARAAEVRGAWEDLALNKSMQTIFEDLQETYPPFAPCFDGDYNPNRAAQRDGEKKVIGHIWKKLEAAKLRLHADNKEKPTTTIL